MFVVDLETESISNPISMRSYLTTTVHDFKVQIAQVRYEKQAQTHVFKHMFFKLKCSWWQVWFYFLDFNMSHVNVRLMCYLFVRDLNDFF